MTGAFSIEEHETALRWASMMQPDEHRVLVRTDFKDAEELLLVFWPDQTNPAFAIQRMDTTVLLIDSIGMAMPFLTLADALMAMSPNLKARRHDLLHGQKPACLVALPQILTDGAYRLGWRGFALHLLKTCRRLRCRVSQRPLGLEFSCPRQH